MNIFFYFYLLFLFFLSIFFQSLLRSIDDDPNLSSCPSLSQTFPVESLIDSINGLMNINTSQRPSSLDQSTRLVIADLIQFGFDVLMGGLESAAGTSCLGLMISKVIV